MGDPAVCCIGRTMQMRLVYYRKKFNWGLDSLNNIVNTVLTLDGHSIHGDQFFSLLALKACLLVFYGIQ